MNRVVALGFVGWIAFVALGGCQGADPFDRAGGGGGATGGGGKVVSGNGGHIVTGNGGSIVTGNGGSGAGGSGLGGLGAGGSSMGGRGAGGSAAGGAGGLGAGGSNVGGRGMGGSGAGGRVDAGANCVSAIAAAGYTAGTAAPCSACMDQNHNSYQTKCMMMIDCMAGQPQPCTGNCELSCFNSVGGNGPLQGCVDALLMAGGCQ